MVYLPKLAFTHTILCSVVFYMIRNENVSLNKIYI